MRARAFAIAAVLSSLASTGVAAADPTSAARADQSFKEGVALATAGKYAEACPKFEESQTLDPALGTEFNLADCYEHTGRAATAWTLFQDVAKRAGASGKTERQQIARARAQALDARVPRLRIVLAHADPDLQILRDGVRVPSDALGEAFPLDVGEHTVEASAPGKKPWQTKVAMQEGRSLEVHVPDLAPLDTALAAPEAPKAPSAPSADASSEGSNPLRILGLGVAGAGVVGIGLGAFFGLRASSKNDDSNADGHCDGSGCDSRGKQDRNDALGAARVATISFVAGGVLLAGGALLFFTAKPVTKATARRTVVVTPGLGGMSLQGTW